MLFHLLSLIYIYVLSRAFDHICMEKARYKFLIIIIIIKSLFGIQYSIQSEALYTAIKNRYCDSTSPVTLPRRRF